MKVIHRIRRYLIPLLLFILHCSTAISNPPAPDFTKCNQDSGSLRCIVHASCEGGSQPDDEYIQGKAAKIQASCARYLLVQAKTLHEVEIEFRDDVIEAKWEKATGATFQNRMGDAFKCAGNKATSTKVPLNADNSAPQYSGLFCKFKVTHANKDILSLLQDEMPNKIVGKSNGNDVTIRIGGVSSFVELFVPCDWSLLNHARIEDNEEEKVLESVDQDSKRKCPPKYFNWYIEGGNKKKIGDFTCFKGKVQFEYKSGGTALNIEQNPGETKCTLPKCSTCACPAGVCNTPDPAKPRFNESDGSSCSKINCPSHKYMLVNTGSDDEAYLSDTIECSSDSSSGAPKWKGDIRGEIKNVTCVHEISCRDLHRMESICNEQIQFVKNPKTQIGENMNCSLANLNNEGTEVCGEKETWFVPAGQGQAMKRYLNTFTCNKDNGKWKGPQGTDIVPKSNVYCLEKIPEVIAAPQTGGISGGALIGIILGIAVGAIAIGAVVFLIMRCRIKKKGNRDEMKSVSVTGRNEKKSRKNKKKGGKSSSSKTSEQISAPPPPPCPDSMNLPNELDPPVPPPSGPASGPAPPVGPDTGKPDKPAELIDIKLESEKKNESSKKEDKSGADGTVANTVTGTSFGDKSKAEPAKDATVTDTKKADKNGESGRSDTGRTGTTKTKKNVKKIQLDKNGRGLTDDDDYNIDEGAKPVNHEDKNKKPYAPPVDPRKKMINVTMTEDDDGHMKPKAKPSLY